MVTCLRAYSAKKKLPERQVLCIERQHTLRGLFKLFMSFFSIFASSLLLTSLKPYPLSNIHPSCNAHRNTQVLEIQCNTIVPSTQMEYPKGILWAFLFRKRGDMCCTICQNSIPNSFTTLPILMRAPQTILNTLSSKQTLKNGNNLTSIHSYDLLCIGTQDKL